MNIPGQDILQVLDALKEVYLQGSATSLPNLLGFESAGDSGIEDGGTSQESSSGETWMLGASTLPLLLDISKEVVISDPYRVMTYSKQPDHLAFREENIFIKPSRSNEVNAGSGTCPEEPTKRNDLFDRQGKSKFRHRNLRRRKKKKRIASFSPSFSSPAKIFPSSAPVKIKKGVALISPEEVAFNQN